VLYLRLLIISSSDLMRTRHLLVLVLLISFISFRCQEIVKFDLPSTNTQLITQAELDYWPHQPDRNGAWVRVTTSGNYYDENASDPITNARVQIEKLSTSRVHDLPPIENQPGLYQSNTVPVDSDKTYQLRVDYGRN
jgi:hypothetical protein